MNYPNYKTMDKGKCRDETRNRLPAFGECLRKSLTNKAIITIEYPQDPQLAATVRVSLKHVDNRRAIDFENGSNYAYLTDDEKDEIGVKVGVAASNAGLEALLKPSWSSKGCLVYRVFWKE